MDSKKIQTLFNELEELIGKDLGTLLKNGEVSNYAVDKIIRDDYTINTLESALETIVSFFKEYQSKNSKNLFDDLNENNFKLQAFHLKTIMSSISNHHREANETLKNIPATISKLAQEQIQDVCAYYRKNHMNNDTTNLSIFLKKEENKNKDQTTLITEYLTNFYYKKAVKLQQDPTIKDKPVRKILFFTEYYKDLLVN